MKMHPKQMIGVAALCATMGLAPAASAATAVHRAKSIEVSGQVEHMRVGETPTRATYRLGVVTPDGQVYLLLPSSSSEAAFKAAEGLAGRNEWATVSGVLVHRDGLPSLRVGQIRKT
jgi:hypothetical protein